MGLRARHNPEPIDLNTKGKYKGEHFFEPLKEEEKGITIIRGEYYLFGSKEVLTIPSNRNVELKSHSHIGLHGPLHFAGFIDNGFRGDLVFEVRSDELSSMFLEDGMPISKLDVFRTHEPEKLYGEEIGSHYHGQTGPKLSKYFKNFDFEFAARNYRPLSRLVLVQDTKKLMQHREPTDGFQPMDTEKFKDLSDLIENGFFHWRYDCEFDDLVLQPIPYLLLFGPERTIFAYVRASNIQDYGDERLFGKHSIGLGGHIQKSDGPNFITTGLKREVFKEEIRMEGTHTPPKFEGTLVYHETPVDNVHFGLLYTSHLNGTVTLNERSIISGGMTTIDSIKNDPDVEQKFETWSKRLIPYLHMLYER